MEQHGQTESFKQLQSGNLLRLILAFSLPAIASYFISELYNMVDTYFVGNTIGADAVGALGIIFPVQRLIIALSLLFAFAITNQMSLCLGAKQTEDASRIISEGIALNFIFMLPLTSLVYFFEQPLLKLLGAKETLLPLASEYLQIIIWGAIFLTLGTTLARILLALGEARLSLYLTISGALINLILDYILVVNWGLGVKGAAIATLISQIASCLLAIYFFSRSLKRIHLHLSFNFRWCSMGRLILIGLPSFVVECEDAIVLAGLNWLLSISVGVSGINSLALAVKVYLFTFVLILGFAYGMQPIIAFNIGAKAWRRVSQTLKLTTILNFAVSLLATILTYFFTPTILAFIVPDAQLIARTTPYFRQMICLLPLITFYYGSVMYLQASARALASSVLSVMRQILLLLPVCYLAVLVFGQEGYFIFLAYPLVDLVVGILGFILLIWQLKRLKQCQMKT